MKNVKFTNDEKSLIVHKVKLYFDKELDQKIGQFDAEFLIDFFSEHIGAYYYNRGLADARNVIESKLDDIDASIYELEKPTELSK
ncbi:MAG: hypothetical protein COA42_20010 [Alteromonadaceae bacterium]|nr:MAG: hypothetical protein COA42_20010 [Alteromonadaceae bacterium]